METRHEIRGLHVITDETYVLGRTHEQVALAAVAGGASVVQLRDKTASSKRLYEVALGIREITAAAGVTFVVNDRLDIALAVGADGVHIGQDDLPIGAVRRIVGNKKIIGVSASSLEEALAAARAGADYVGFGSVFPTGSKADAGEPVGLEELARASAHIEAPVIAIGGISASNLADVMAAGAAGAAVISAVAAEEDMEQATCSLVEIMAAAGGPEVKASGK